MSAHIMSEAVKVAVRVRPFNGRETSLQSTCVLSMRGNTTVLAHPSAASEPRTYTFDHRHVCD